MKHWMPPSIDWTLRAQESIAHGALTNSKRPSCLVRGIYPTHLKKGAGGYVWDVDDRRYIDFVCGLGSNLLGYGHHEVTPAAINAAWEGVSLSLGSTVEVELAEKVKEIIPFVEQVRFLKTGSEACSAALRIARSKTKRATILTEGYHGWHDEFVSMTPPAHGIYGAYNIEALKTIDQIDETVGAVIVEPYMTALTQERTAWLRDLRERCDRTKTLLIFDEIITGFRFPGFTASRYSGVTPDLICLGKAMGNGFPIACVGGKKEVMECEEYFVSSTYAGDRVALAAALKTITLLQSKYPIDSLWSAGKNFLDQFNQICPDLIKIEGYPTRGTFQGDQMAKALFWQECCKAGILFGPSWFVNFSQIDLLDSVLHTCADVLSRIKVGAVRLEGELPSSPFAQKMREQR